MVCMLLFCTLAVLSDFWLNSNRIVCSKGELNQEYINLYCWMDGAFIYKFPYKGSFSPTAREDVDKQAIPLPPGCKLDYLPFRLLT